MILIDMFEYITNLTTRKLHTTRILSQKRRKLRYVQRTVSVRVGFFEEIVEISSQTSLPDCLGSSIHIVLRSGNGWNGE